MHAFEWNALREGDRVSVHDDGVPAMDLREGVVTVVQTRPGQVNDVAIQLDGDTGAAVRPRIQAVHLLPFDGSTFCWRCEPQVEAGHRSGGADGKTVTK